VDDDHTGVQRLPRYFEGSQCFLVITQIGLVADQDERDVGGVMLDFGPPLRLDVVKRHSGEPGNRYARYGAR